jgi:integrase
MPQPSVRRAGLLSMVGTLLSTSLASHTDLKIIQQMLGHSSIVTTADTYTSVLPEAAHRSAQATADMIIKAARSAPRSRRGETNMPHILSAITASGYCQM